MNALLVFTAIEAGGLQHVSLFAAPKGVDFMMVLAFIIFFLIPFLGKILTALKAAPPKPPVRPPRPVQPSTPSTVQNEIEDFLRRANQKKTTPTARPQRPQPVRSKSGEKPVRAEVVRAEVVRERPVGGDVEQHVKKYLDEEGFERRSKKMGEEVAESDDKIERHLKSVFDHSLSKIAATPGVTASPTSTKLADTAPEITLATPSVAATDIAALFGNPLSVRQAVLISEILNRPLERWDREASFDAAAWERRQV
jgi:hypothetical protein